MAAKSATQPVRRVAANDRDAEFAGQRASMAAFGIRAWSTANVERLADEVRLITIVPANGSFVRIPLKSKLLFAASRRTATLSDVDFRGRFPEISRTCEGDLVMMSPMG